MRFLSTRLPGAYIIDLDPHTDHRGFFARTFCAEEFEAHGLHPRVAQCSLAFTYRQGVIRGMHYQIAPATETKLVRCTRGAIYDVIVDLRPESPTYMSHIGVELTADNRCALYVPAMFAHGYQSLTDETEVMYQMNEFYAPEWQRGVRYDDPVLGIGWPLPVSDLSERDAAWPLWSSIALEAAS